ncbi:MAG TPA: TIGR03617 family F420-dependent LLM class oxidoreductase, partial [Acidimicrobiia bacterium]|nr:TIGR03617 family F420-dependent LLM class oxidoreductase [Acidimicrobiia bacterium]
MKVDGALVNVGLAQVAARARELESTGYDALYTFEGPHDPFFPLLLAAEHTERVELMTAIAIAFARNPMNLAQLGDDLQRASHGRFVLGLGTQVKPHIEKRFSMTWSSPVERMRELVTAVRAIWATWHDRVPLDFRGDHYRHTLMTPFFDPGPSEYGPPRVFLAGVGPRMTEMAGEMADGFIVHPFASEQSLRELTLPALARGRARSALADAAFEVALPALVATGTTDAELESAVQSVRAQLAFYGSTPAYKVVLDVHGWGDLQPELNRLSKEGRWDVMAGLFTDEMVDTFAV